MDERVDGLERQLLEFRDEQTRFMETMMKRMEEMMLRQPQGDAGGLTCTSRITDTVGDNQDDLPPPRSDGHHPSRDPSV